MSSRINFHYVDIKSKFVDRKNFSDFLCKIFDYEWQTLEKVDVLFCSDIYLLDLNKKFLRHDFFTDTITFNYNLDGNPVIGEVYISLDRIKDNAIVYKTNYQEELKRVIIHGVLHLCGYSDKKKHKKVMTIKQEDYLKFYYVSRETKRNV